jgi:murein DD-endopeptidase MepM/ murein hydrolase activator NlpD
MLDGTDTRTSALASFLGLVALVSVVFGLEFQLAPSSPAVPPEPSVTSTPSPGLVVPVVGVARSDLTRQFDEHRSGGRSHRAIDILAPRGTPVLAAGDGRIERLLHNRLGGNTIYQRDPVRGFVYYYAHLQRYRTGLTEGDEVRQGEVIGYVGSTGNASPNAPHLHFAIERDGEPVDPYDELAVSRLATR